MSYAIHLRSLERALATVAAVGITAVGLGAMDQSTATTLRRLTADANAQRNPAVPMPFPQSLAPQGRGELDPVSHRLENGADHHG